ncbi:hypothetical protein Y032_0865g2759 [Ancylostoma ceylanicum]|uniref:NR LBD domain-containing protein n=1 Tax=Ancylostoma ceylanicum TaxID=53326 RepID=A0A016WAS2_9BILA|nr:hypothetical protein Y032_0865g2759 [Ancylostoma ceylanicum]
MSSGKRSKCRSCRFQRCLKARMCPEEVGKLRDLKLPDRLVIEAKEESSVVPYLDLTSLRYPSEAIQSMRIPLIERFGVAEGVKCIARMFVNLESTCDNDTYASSVPDRFFCNLDISLKQALQNPLLVSERTPLCWRGSKPLEDTRSALKPSYCRLVLHYLEWLSAIDDLMAFDELQRIRVTTTHMIPAILLTMTFNSFKHDSSRILLCNGFYYSANKCEREEYGLEVDLIVSELETKILSKFRELNVRDEEYVLLKLIVLFTGRQAEDEETSEAMRKIRRKYIHLLVHLVNNALQNHFVEKPFDRLHALLQLISPLISISDVVELCLIHAVALDIAGMRGELTFDFHLREYL